jgi:TonB family protein
MDRFVHDPNAVIDVEQVLGGRYRVVRRLATGGMATVYLAEHTLIGRSVAIKILHPHYAGDAECVRRFLAEGRTAGTLGHPNIVESTDMGYTSGGAPFLVLELLEGRTLHDVIRRRGPLPVDRALRIAQQIASALSAAHARGIIHRDLKSGNVFLVDREGGDHVKVLDFGISKFKEASGHTQQGGVLGTPWFMSPEQINDPSSVDARCDIYGLGVILYEMLAGDVPFADSSFPKLFNRILWEEPTPVEALRPEVGPELAALVRRAMAKSLGERTNSMEELGHALAALAGQSSHGDAARAREMEEDDDMITAWAATRPAMPMPRGTPVAGRRWGEPMPRWRDSLVPTTRRGRLVAGIGGLGAAVAIAALVDLWPASGSLSCEAQPADPAATATAGATTETMEERPETRMQAPADPEPLSVTRLPDDPEAAGVDARVELVIESPTRGARATFRGETYRLPVRERLEPGDEAELVEVRAPGQATERLWITLDRSQTVRVGPGRARRSSSEPPARPAREEAADAPLVGEPERAEDLAEEEEDPEAESEQAELDEQDEPPPSSKPSPPARPADTARRTAKADGPAPGTLDPDATRKVVRRRLPQVQTCFQRGRMDNPQLSGRVLVRIDVGPSGKVISARIARSSLDNQTVESCIVSTVKSWTLPAPAGGVPATITYPFVFH